MHFKRAALETFKLVCNHTVPQQHETCLLALKVARPLVPTSVADDDVLLPVASCRQCLGSKMFPGLSPSSFKQREI